MIELGHRETQLNGRIDVAIGGGRIQFGRVGSWRAAA